MNKKLAILGHQTRGREVIEILEMLGGHNYSSGLLGKAENFYYYIGNFNSISFIHKEKLNDSFITFTLEEFLAKFPYKVRDKVLINAGENICTIKSMTWDKKNGRVAYRIGEINGILENKDFWFANEMELYLEKKEENMEETIIDTIKESNDRYRLHINHQYDIEVDEGEYYVVRRKPQYPKTYEECCQYLGCDDKIKMKLIGQFTQLINARNAYWKLAGEQMGLGKSWKPKHEYDEEIFFIYCDRVNGINKGQGFPTDNFCLVFPTKEMRDAFFENFKELIEICKEFL